MKNKRGNVAVIALIIMIVAITTGVITWLVATKTQVPVQQAVVTQPAPVAQTKSTVQLNTEPIMQQSYYDYYMQLLQQGTTGKSLAIIGSELEKRGYSKDEFDIVTPEEFCCGTCEKYEITQGEKEAYNLLKSKKIIPFIELFSDQSYFGMFAICSAKHNVVFSVPSKNGIILLTYAGNGTPEVEASIATNYSLSFLAADDNKVVLFEKELNGSEFFGNKISKYNDAMNNESYEEGRNIIDALEWEIRLSLETGLFENKYLQKAYMDLVDSL